MIENGPEGTLFGGGAGGFGDGEHDGRCFFDVGTFGITFLLKEEYLILHILNINPNIY